MALSCGRIRLSTWFAFDLIRVSKRLISARRSWSWVKRSAKRVSLSWLEERRRRRRTSFERERLKWV